MATIRVHRIGDPLPDDNERPKSQGEIDNLICKGLGYCCEWAFFSCFRQTGMIAARLGVSERAVRYKKEQFRTGQILCKGYKHCMKKALQDF